MRRSNTVLGVGALLMSCAMLGCGGDSAGVTIADGPLSGKIGGVAFTFSTGETEAFLSMDATYFVNLYGVAFSACDVSGGPPLGSNAVIFEVPKTAGTYNLGLNQFATLYDGATAFNHIATRGAIVIDSIVGTTIMGGANITFNADNAVDGKFQATICP